MYASHLRREEGSSKQYEGIAERLFLSVSLFSRVTRKGQLVLSFTIQALPLSIQPILRQLPHLRLNAQARQAMERVIIRSLPRPAHRIPRFHLQLHMLKMLRPDSSQPADCLGQVDIAVAVAADEGALSVVAYQRVVAEPMGYEGEGNGLIKAIAAVAVAFWVMVPPVCDVGFPFGLCGESDDEKLEFRDQPVEGERVGVDVLSYCQHCQNALCDLLETHLLVTSLCFFKLLLLCGFDKRSFFGCFERGFVVDYECVGSEGVEHIFQRGSDVGRVAFVVGVCG